MPLIKFIGGGQLLNYDYRSMDRSHPHNYNIVVLTVLKSTPLSLTMHYIIVLNLLTTKRRLL
jgi:hypothetical protein